jgi:hypothetical protein
MVVIVQCVIWGNAFKFVYVETMNECRHKMKRDSSQTRFGFLSKNMEVAFKLKRYIFKLHLSRFQFAMHLKFCIIYNWRSCVLYGFKLWYRVLLRFPHVVFVLCVVNMTMMQKLLELVARFTSKSKPTLL